MYKKQAEGDITSRQSGLVDIHSHILPGLDDGPVDHKQCIEAAKRYIELGFESVIATPHWICATTWTPTPDIISRKVKELNMLLHENNIALTILPGMEIAYSEKLYEHLASSQCIPLGGKGFFLIEFPLVSTLTRLSEDTFTKLDNTRNKFIIAHPERCQIFHHDRNMMERLVSMGMLVQINISSLLGEYGSKVQKFAFYYIRSGMAHFLATDSHARKNRKPPDKSQWSKLTKLVGEEIITTAFGYNPKQMLAGKDVIPLSLNTKRTSIPALPDAGRVFLKTLHKLLGKY